MRQRRTASACRGRLAPAVRLFGRRAGLVAGVSNRIVNGWLFPPPTLGATGAVDDDFRGRAICSIGGIICNDATEAVYIVAFADVDGQKLDGANRYTMRFEKGALPPANEFWSLTMYDPAHNLVDNPINRYAIRDRTPGVKQEADGSLRRCSDVR